MLLNTAPAARAVSRSRAHIVLPSALAVDVAAQTVTLPLLRGHVGSETVWYIVTDSSDQTDAAKRGVIYAPLIANVGLDCAARVQHVTENNGDGRRSGRFISTHDPLDGDDESTERAR